MQGGTKIFGVFCVKNHDFMQKNHIFSNFRGGVHTPMDLPLWYKIPVYSKHKTWSEVDTGLTVFVNDLDNIW